MSEESALETGYTDQLETPLIPIEPFPTYAVNVTGVSVGVDDLGVQMLALFDTGTSFTHLTEPAYSLITKAFDGNVTDKRRPIDPEIPFEFCYDSSPNNTTFKYPRVGMTFVGGSVMILNSPLFVVWNEDNSAMYCLGIMKSVNFKLNIIGQNFMSGYRVVFDRERMILGWKLSNCFEDESLASQPAPPPEIEAPPPKASNPSPSTASVSSPPIDPHNSTENSGTGGAVDLIPLASQLLLLLLLLAFL